MAHNASQKSTSSRSCGSCGVCCHILEIEALSKGRRRDCVHLNVSKSKKPGRCTAYEGRPVECRDFACLWLTTPWFGKKLRPDRSKLMFVAYAPGHGEQRCITIFEVTQYAFDRNLENLDNLMQATNWPTEWVVVREDVHKKRFLVGGPRFAVESLQREPPDYLEARGHVRWIGVPK